MEQEMQEKGTDNPNFPYWLMAVSYKLHVTKALINWCDETLAKLKKND